MKGIDLDSATLIANILVAMLALAAFACIRRARVAAGAPANGHSREWKFSDLKSTEIISNKRIGYIQKVENSDAITSNDKIIVWAREFLDNDVLYNQVLHNIQNKVSYLYIVSYRNRDKFIELIQKLDINICSGCYKNLVDVIFVTDEMTLNNIVVFYKKEKASRRCFSSLIYGDLPFGWVAQSPSRVEETVTSVKRLLYNLALYQHSRTCTKHSVPLHVPYADQQIMDYSVIWKLLSDDPIGFDLHAVLETVYLPDDVLAKAAALPKTDPPPATV